MSISEGSSSVTDDLESSSNSETEEDQQYNKFSALGVSDQSSSENSEGIVSQHVSPTVADDSDVGPSVMPELPRKGKEKDNTGDSRPDYDTEGSALEQAESKMSVYEGRPNRFYGATSTWNTWTGEERETADSLPKERAKDLSAHLFNAFALRSRARHHRMNVVAGRAGSNSDGTDEFKPPKVWTAWPMPPDEVPREHRKLIWDPSDKATFQGKQDLRPSAELEEMIIATTLRLAKDRFNGRESASGGSRSVSSESHSSADGSSDEGSVTKSREASHSSSPMAGLAASHGFEFNEMYTSQPYESNEPITEVGKHEEVSENEGHDMSLMFMADDEEARLILRPTARHILSKMDDLLMGLHTIRASYAHRNIKRRSKNVTGEATEATTSAWSSSEPRKRKRVRTSNSRTDTKLSDSESTSKVRRTKNMRSSHRTPADVQNARLALRDWSELLGTASITGWKSDVAGRAAERCAVLFGEDMQFRTFFEGKRSGRKPAEAYFVEHTASGREPARNSEEPLQPAGWITEAESDFEASTDLESENDRPKLLSCPISDCEKHSHIFRNWRELQKHMKKLHSAEGQGRNRNKKSAKLSSSSSPGFTETEAGEEAEAGEDTALGNEKEFFCPEADCPRAQKPFSRRSNLYNHIRKLHKGVDIAEFKRLQVKRRGGERRGKWNDERRQRRQKRSTTPFLRENSEMERGD